MGTLTSIETIYDCGVIFFPEGFKPNKRCRVIITFLEELETVNESMELAKMQSMTGFAQEVLNSPSEDIWNDL